jgi:hypothetical protein
MLRRREQQHRVQGATSQTSLVLQEAFGGIACTGWPESSADNGKNWAQVTPTYALSYDGGQDYAFSPAVADRTGQLVRACAQSTGAKSAARAGSPDTSPESGFQVTGMTSTPVARGQGVD